MLLRMVSCAKITKPSGPETDLTVDGARREG